MPCDFTRVKEINKEIKQLKRKFKAVKGTETEVYTRIVGYYRAIKNWNIGKREEYEFRAPFAVPTDERTKEKFQKK